MITFTDEYGLIWVSVPMLGMFCINWDEWLDNRKLVKGTLYS